MQWLLDHSIANMYGPHFLVLYGTVIILTVGACWWMIQRRPNPLYGKDETPAPQGVMQVERIKLSGACVIVGLGGYKLLIALAKGRHNVGFLIIMCIVSLCVLFAMRASPGRKNSERSKRDEFVSKGSER